METAGGEAGGVACAIRLRIGERFQEYPFDHAENRGVGADADGQGRNGDGGEHGGMR